MPRMRRPRGSTSDSVLVAKAAYDAWSTTLCRKRHQNRFIMRAFFPITHLFSHKQWGFPSRPRHNDWKMLSTNTICLRSGHDWKILRPLWTSSRVDEAIFVVSVWRCMARHGMAQRRLSIQRDSFWGFVGKCDGWSESRGVVVLRSSIREHLLQHLL